MTKQARIDWLRNCTAKERSAYYDSVASIGCLVCRDVVNVAIHHCTGHGFPASRLLRPVIPLCTNKQTGFGHHQGNGSIHAGKASFQAKYGTQDELLEKVEAML